MKLFIDSSERISLFILMSAQLFFYLWFYFFLFCTRNVRMRSWGRNFWRLLVPNLFLIALWMVESLFWGKFLLVELITIIFDQSLVPKLHLCKPRWGGRYRNLKQLNSVESKIYWLKTFWWLLSIKWRSWTFFWTVNLIM